MNSRLNAVNYLDSDDAIFELVTEDLFEEARFGYNRVGLLTTTNGMMYFRIPIERNRIRDAVLTLCDIFHVTCFGFDSEQPANEKQLVYIQTTADAERMGYSHAVGGYVNSELVCWLREYVREYGNVFPEDVLDAMRDVWTYVAPDDLQQYAKHIEGYLRDDGSFILTCFGDACDMGIYPDQISYDIESEGAILNFSCHNLDTMYQQVTLLSGLAKLLGKVRPVL